MNNQTAILYKDTQFEYYDGDCVQSSYDAKVECLQEGIYSVWLNIPPQKGVVKVKIRFDINASYRQVCVRNFLDSGIIDADKLEDDVKCEFFMSLLNDGDDITVMNRLPCKFYSEIHLLKDQNTLVLETQIPETYRGDLMSESFIVVCGKPHTFAMEYGADQGAINKKWENVIGWGSWDYYFATINQDDVRENVDFICNDELLSKKIKYIAIDDGWQQREGDWREGVRFSDGFKKTTDYIISKGYIPGIWTSPTMLSPACATVGRRNGFLARDEYGDPVMVDGYYVLDPTHPDGEQFVRETFSYLKQNGFGFYKIDYLSNLLRLKRFHDTNAGPYDALKKLITTIRECVGPESHIMGCSLPYGYGGEGIDSRRVSLDIHNTWKHILKCTEIAYSHIPSHRKVYNNDMDYLVVRGKDTSVESDTNVLNPMKNHYAAFPTKDFRWRDGPDFSYSEAKFWCGIILMTGSSVVLSDRLTMLNQNGLKLIKTTVQYADFDVAKPAEFCGRLPEIWYKKSNGALYIFNFSDDTRSYSIDVNSIYGKDVSLFDIFEGANYASDNGKLNVTLKAHDSLSLYIK